MINYMWVDIINHLKEHFYLFLSLDESFLQFSLNMYVLQHDFFQKYLVKLQFLNLGVFLNVWKSISVTDQKHVICRQSGYLCNNCSLIEAEATTKDLEVEEAVPVFCGFFSLSVRTALAF